MSALATKWAYQLQEAEQIPPTAHHVLLCLADRFNEQHKAAWPSYRDISARTGLSERTIARAIDELEALTIVRRVPRLHRGRKVGLAYRFPRYDGSWAAERQGYDFDEHGHYDEERAAENLSEMQGIYYE